jgi:hypothetical protein
MGVKIILTNGKEHNIPDVAEVTDKVVEELAKLDIEATVADSLVENSSVISSIVIGSDNAFENAVVDIVDEHSLSSADVKEIIQDEALASKIYFTEDFIYTVDIGTYKVPTGAKFGTIPAAGKTVSEVLSDIFKTEVGSTRKLPSFKITLTNDTNQDLEIGNKIEKINYATVFTDGTYSQGTVEDTQGSGYSTNTAAGCEISSYPTIDFYANKVLYNTVDITATSTNGTVDCLNTINVNTNTLSWGIVSEHNFGTDYTICYDVNAQIDLSDHYAEDTLLEVTFNNINLPTSGFLAGAQNVAELGYSIESAQSSEECFYCDEQGNILGLYSCEILKVFNGNGEDEIISSFAYTIGDISNANTGSYSNLTVQLTGNNFILSLAESNIGITTDSVSTFISQYFTEDSYITVRSVSEPIIDSTTEKIYLTANINASNSLQYNAATKFPATNLAQYDSNCEQIPAGSISNTTASLKLTGYRKCFYKINDKDSVISVDGLKSDDVRNTFTYDSTTPSALPTKLNLNKGTQQLVFLAPAGIYTKFSVTDVTNPQATFTLGNTKHAKAIKVEGANNFTSIDYDMWVISLDTPYPTDAIINIERSK